MKKKLLILSILISLLSGNPVFGRNTFKNPILSGMNPDPSICRVGDDFYLVTSSFEYFPGLPVYHSKDLVHWKLIGHALSSASSNPLMGCEASTGGQYAPTLRYHNGLFYVIGTNYGGKGTQGVFYVTAKNPAGPWSEPIWTGHWYVDPSLEFIGDTTYYLSPDNKGSFLLGIIDPKTGKFTEPLRKVATGLGGSSPEGPHFYRINDYYYIMSAEGGTGYQHREVIQRSKSPWGPYEASPNNPVLSNRSDTKHPIQAIGHADLVQLKDGSWWAVCLGIRPQNGKYQHLGRETFLAPVTWDNNGWPKVGKNGIVEEEYSVPNLPQHVWEKEPVQDDFINPTLNLHWNFIRNPHPEDWSLTENPGYLRLKGSEVNFREKDSPAFIGKRQSTFNIVVSTKISFVPASGNEEAGLVVRANDKNHYDLLITQFEGKRTVIFRKYLKDKVADIRYKEIPDGDIVLRISATESEYKFWVQEEDATATLIGTASTKDVSNEVVGGFTGVFIGMYASGNGKANTHPADFDWFDFEENCEMISDAATLAKKMNIGWNLGNSLEACRGMTLASETLWGNPKTSKIMIDKVKEAGFNTIRIPCAWNAYVEDSNTYKIKDSWLARVKEVVDYCIDNDIYTIINIHWDGGWLEENPTYNKQLEINKKQKALWEQIAVYFRDYDERLLFAGTNEVRADYGIPSEENIAVQMSYNQTFVNAVRSTGGKNTWRNLIIQAYNTNIDHAVNYLKMPVDPTPNRLMVEVHYYDPYEFCLKKDDTVFLWGKNFTGEGTVSWGQEDWVDSQFGKMKTHFVDKGIPVILGEYAAMLKTSLSGEDNINHIKSRNHYLNYITKTAIANGIIPIYWDNGSAGNYSFGLFDRATGKQVDEDAIAAIITAKSSNNSQHIAQYIHPFQNTSLSDDERLDNLLSLMTLDEKINALSTNLGVSRLGIRATGHSEGLHGMALGGPGNWGGYKMENYQQVPDVYPTTIFPQAYGLGETWDTELIRKVADIESTEARYYTQNERYKKGGLIMRAPNADLARDPRWGRTEESFGEDPYLVSEMTVAFIKGLQGENPKYWKSASLMKHFLANSNEDGRDSTSSNFDNRLFHEYYAYPFRKGIETGGSQAFMASYNAWNGVAMTVHPVLEKIRKEWDMKGIICTDGGALNLLITAHKSYPTHTEGAAAIVKAGVGQFLGNYRPYIYEALEKGLLTEKDIDGAIRGNFFIALRLGLLDGGQTKLPYGDIGVVDTVAPWQKKEVHDLVRLATAKSVVLLKNEKNLLPLNKDKSNLLPLLVREPTKFCWTGTAGRLLIQ